MPTADTKLPKSEPKDLKPADPHALTIRGAEVVEFGKEYSTIDTSDVPEEYRSGFTSYTGFAPTVNFSDGAQVGDTVYGVFKGVEEEVGPNKSMLYMLETIGGKLVSVWGSWDLDRQFRISDAKIGDKVSITYCGEARTTRGLNPVKKFLLRVKRQKP